MDHAYRHLRAEKLIETAERLARRVAGRFPGSGLAQVAGAVVEVTRDAVQQSERIQRPNWVLRGVLLGVAALAVAGAVAMGLHLRGQDAPALQRVAEFMRATSGAAVYLGAVVVFFVTLEVRFKRAKAVKAVHELRALAHLIDMHQLTKDPDRVGQRTESPDGGTVMSAEEMGRYLHYCTELLALVSKIGQLYVQDFPDGTALAAVDQFENLATGLSQKTWQKIMILDQLRDPAAPRPLPDFAPRPAAAGPAPAARRPPEEAGPADGG
jgi:hypothetical protein